MILGKAGRESLSCLLVCPLTISLLLVVSYLQPVTSHLLLAVYYNDGRSKR